MSASTGQRAVVCDDDSLIRSVVRQLLEETGYEVVAEVDNPLAALEACRSAEAHVLVLDLALRAGHGEEVITTLADEGSTTKVVVFSAYVSDAGSLLAKGAAAVVDKPGFEQLEAAISKALEPSDGPIQNRRRDRQKPIQALPPATGLTISGLEPWASFTVAAGSLLEGDAVIALDVLPDVRTRAIWDHVYRTDFRLAVARAVAVTLRTQDRITLTPAGLPLAALVGGHLEAPGSVFDRLESTWKREVAAGTPVGAFTHVSRVLEPAQAIERVLDAMETHDFHADHPLRMV